MSHPAQVDPHDRQRSPHGKQTVPLPASSGCHCFCNMEATKPPSCPWRSLRRHKWLGEAQGQSFAPRRGFLLLLARLYMHARSRKRHRLHVKVAFGLQTISQAGADAGVQRRNHPLRFMQTPTGTTPCARPSPPPSPPTRRAIGRGTGATGVGHRRSHGRSAASPGHKDSLAGPKQPGS